MIVIPNDIQALLFDLDGTFADTMPIHIEAWKAAGKKYGANITDDMIQRTSGRPTIAVVDILNEENGWQLIPAEMKAAKDVAFEAAKISLGIRPIPLIFDLARRHLGKLPMAIGTGSTRPRTEDTLNALGVMHWFDAIVTADDVQNFKPSPDTFLLCAAKLAIDPARCLVFEDADFGLRAAIAAGMRVVDVREYL